MIGRSPQVNKAKWIAIAIGVFVLNLLPTHSYSKEKVMSKEISVWELIERVGAMRPLHKEQVESLLAAKVAMTSENESYTFWDGTADLPLSNNMKITKVSFSTANPTKPADLSMSVYLGGTCVSKQDLLKHFPTIEVVGAPRGRSLDEETVFSANTNWGKVKFGFTERAPDCLARLGFNFSKAQPQG